MKVRNIIALLVFFLFSVVQGQEIDILIKNGHVFDPKNGIDDIMDVGISEGKIAVVAPNIEEERAEKVINATGLYVSPGLIDIHTHVFVGPSPGQFADGVNSVSADDFSFKSGVTTMVDAGTSGWRNFPKFKTQVIDQSKTRILAFLNIAAYGISKPDVELTANEKIRRNLDDMDVVKTIEMIQKYPESIVGVKIGHFEGKTWLPFEKAVEAASATNRPLFVECHLPEYSLLDQLDRMRPGDIITHSYEHISERTPIVDDEGLVLPYVMDAKERGILFDVGHGGAGFWFDQAIPSMQQGFWPNSFGTDLHRFSMNAGMKDMLNLMSKYLAMNMPLKEVLLRASWYPARSINREDLGNLSVGAVADVTLLGLVNGQFGFVDAANNKINGNLKFTAEITIRAGNVVWDLNGLSAKTFMEQ